MAIALVPVTVFLSETTSWKQKGKVRSVHQPNGTELADGYDGADELSFFSRSFPFNNDDDE